MGSANGDVILLRPLHIQHAVGYDEIPGSHPDAMMHQFSANGNVLITVRHKRGTDSTDTVVNAFDFEDDSCRQSTVTLKNAPTCVPVLSGNGKSLLMLCPPKQSSAEEIRTNEDGHCSGIWLVPKLRFENPHQTTVPVPGDRALWGKLGEYLLVWSTKNAELKLSIYKTKHLRHTHFRYPDPVYERTLRQRQDLSAWKARMMDNRDDDSRLDVLLCETGEDWRIFSVWDVAKNVIAKEVKVILSPGKPVTTGMTEPLTKRWTLRKRSRRPPTPENDFIVSVLLDVFPEFCGSIDREWFAAVSWNHQTAGLASARMGVTAWISTFTEGLLKRPIAMPSEVRFDPVGRHLMLFGEEVIQTFAPPLLEEHFETSRFMEELDQRLTHLDDTDDIKKLMEAYRCLPSKALARAWEIGASSRKKRLAWFRSKKEAYKGEEIVDAALSPNEQLLALIMRDFRGTFSVRVHGTGNCELKGDINGEQLQFPPSARGDVLCPERVFLFKDEDDCDAMAFFSTGKDPVALFCRVDSQVQDAVRLGMSACLMISKGTGLSDVVLLSDDAVCTVSLKERKIVRWTTYQANIAELFEDVKGSLKWRQTQERASRADCWISVDGEAVLLAWDVRNKRSIVVTPATRQEECRRNIQASAKSLSEFCSLSPTGASTAFLDLDDLSQGRLTIGIFSETGKHKLVVN